MHGNCWEWCATPAGLPLAAANSVPAQVAADARRSIRGGGWCHLPNECRSAYRPGDTPDSRHVDLGFRVLLELPR
jgi:formylglycine-generating enzyme required for sulfatase activity